jgi:hypothetical protein
MIANATSGSLLSGSQDARGGFTLPVQVQSAANPAGLQIQRKHFAKY